MVDDFAPSIHEVGRGVWTGRDGFGAFADAAFSIEVGELMFGPAVKLSHGSIGAKVQSTGSNTREKSALKRIDVA